MGVLKAQVVLPHVNGLAKDTVVNTFHFRYVTTASAITDAIRDSLRNFYNADAGSNVILSHFLGSGIDRSKSRIKVYNVGDGPQGPPIADFDLQLLPPVRPDTLPEEVALCLSYAGAPAAGVPMARRRGRVYLGPFTSEALGDNAPSRPGPFCMTAIRAAGQRLLTASKAVNGWAWVVYSQAYAGRAAIPRTTRADLPAIPARAASWVDVNNGWVDNAWDTQRRRGPAPSTRQTFQ